MVDCFLHLLSYDCFLQMFMCKDQIVSSARYFSYLYSALGETKEINA